MINEDQARRLETLVRKHITSDLFTEFAAELNAIVAENEAAWRAEHDASAAEPLPATSPHVVTAEEITGSVMMHVADEALAVSLANAVATKQIAPYAVPLQNQSNFIKTRMLAIFDQLVRHPKHVRFRDFYRANIEVRDVEEEHEIRTSVDPRPLLHIPEVPHRQRATIKQILVKAGAKRAGPTWAKIERVLRPYALDGEGVQPRAARQEDEGASDPEGASTLQEAEPAALAP